MDKIAIISDIHGNIPALETVLKDIENRGIKRIICLGDIAGKGPDSDTAVDIIKEKCESVIKGNWDYLIAEVCDNDMLLWHKRKLGKERTEYLKNLPTYTEFYISGRLTRLCHAGLLDVFDRVPMAASFEEKERLFKGPEDEDKESDVFGYGDIHHAYIENHMGKTIFNAGSVGNPLDINESSYVIIEGTYGSKERSPFSVNFIRLPYDIEKSVKIAEKSGMPDLKPYINELRTAKYRGIK